MDKEEELKMLLRSYLAQISNIPALTPKERQVAMLMVEQTVVDDILNLFS